ncbi:hypothetical protein ACEWY4_016250 [Coilia grayii]|uniref:T-cell surface glycoprotein CD3 zeta chain n=1 Tax=Coilia grayii TaxID=363190 RepID=A0ABD1JJS5_9TELE
MAWQSNGAILLMVLAIPSAEAAMTLFDPKLCYILDGFLMFYGVMITALFVRERCCKPKTAQGQDSTYAALQKRTDDNYQDLRHARADVESGSGRGRRQQDEDSTYSRLNKGTEDTYREIQTKRDHRRQKDDVYQDLKVATKDTYSSLQPRHQPR